MTVLIQEVNSFILGAVFWFASHVYQVWRFKSLSVEDDRFLYGEGSGDERGRWLVAIKKEAANYGVSPTTLYSLNISGELDARTASLVDSGEYARRYNPTLLSESPLLLLYFLAASVGYILSPQLSCFLAASVVLGQEDMRFRIAPVPFLIVFAISGALSFPFGVFGWVLVTAAFVLSFAAISSLVRRLFGISWHAGDYLTLAIALSYVMAAESIFEFLAVHLAAGICLDLLIRYRPSFRRLKDNVPYNVVLSLSLVVSVFLKIMEGVLL